MALVLFDLDNTLLAGDSDHAWGQFLAERNIVDGPAYQRANDEFLQQYHAGRLDILEYLEFALQVLTRVPREELEGLRETFVEEVIVPMILPRGQQLLELHRRRGDTLAIITATNAFVTKPVADRLGVRHLIATEPEEIEGRYTGRVAGVPCFREGKVTRLKAWLAQEAFDMGQAWFYSDSHNDLPLLRAVGYPCAVDPDPALEEMARTSGWPVLYLRDI